VLALGAPWVEASTRQLGGFAMERTMKQQRGVDVIRWFQSVQGLGFLTAGSIWS